MNFLALCKAIHLIARFGEDAPGTAPSTVTNQTGPLAEIVAWANLSYRAVVKSRRHWLFMQGEGLLNMVVGTSEYVPTASGIANYEHCLASEAEHRVSFVGIYLTSKADESPCYYVPYEQWKLGQYDRGQASAGNSRPVRFTMKPDGSLSFYPPPDQTYKARIPYRKALTDLAADADVMVIPDRYAQAVVWHAIRNYYCTTRGATVEFKRNADDQYKQEMHPLTRDQLPDFTTAG